MIQTDRFRKDEKEEEANRKTQKIRRAEQRRAERDKKRRVDKSRKRPMYKLIPVRSITHLTRFPENIGPHCWRLGGGTLPQF